jgi:hypothetical protein
MPKGKPWTTEEETKLKALIQANENINKIAAELQRKKEAIQMKCKRLGLKVVTTKGNTTTTSIPLPPDLPSIEEALRILAGALKTASQPNLDKVEVQRLQVVATISRTYKELLADYINYRAIETKLLEMEVKYAKLAEKTKNNAPQPNTTPMVQPTT